MENCHPTEKKYRYRHRDSIVIGKKKYLTRTQSLKNGIGASLQETVTRTPTHKQTYGPQLKVSQYTAIDIKWDIKNPDYQYRFNSTHVVIL